MNKKDLMELGKSVYNYYKSELEKVEDGHDWTYTMSMKITGTKGETKFLAITKQQFDKIKKIFI